MSSWFARVLDNYLPLDRRVLSLKVYVDKFLDSKKDKNLKGPFIDWLKTIEETVGNINGNLQNFRQGRTCSPHNPDWADIMHKRYGLVEENLVKLNEQVGSLEKDLLFYPVIQDIKLLNTKIQEEFSERKKSLSGEWWMKQELSYRQYFR